MSDYKKNKGGRPRADDARYKGKILSIRLDPMGEAELEKLKRKTGKPAAEVIRELIFRGAIRERMRPVHLEFMAQLKGIARNLNQITKLANGIGIQQVVQKIEPIIAEIGQFLKQVRDDR